MVVAGKSRIYYLNLSSFLYRILDILQLGQISLFFLALYFLAVVLLWLELQQYFDNPLYLELIVWGMKLMLLLLKLLILLM